MSTHASTVATSPASPFALPLYFTSPPPTATPPLPPSPSHPPLSLVKAHDAADGPKPLGQSASGSHCSSNQNYGATFTNQSPSDYFRTDNRKMPIKAATRGKKIKSRRIPILSKKLIWFPLPATKVHTHDINTAINKLTLVPCSSLEMMVALAPCSCFFIKRIHLVYQFKCFIG